MKGDISGNYHTVKVKHPLSGFKADEMEAERYLQQVLLSNSLMTGLKVKLQANDPLQGRALVTGEKCALNQSIYLWYLTATFSEILRTRKIRNCTCDIQVKMKDMEGLPWNTCHVLLWCYGKMEGTRSIKLVVAWHERKTLSFYPISGIPK